MARTHRVTDDARMQRVVVDTTVQPKAMVHLTEAGLMHRALEMLLVLASLARTS